MRFVLAAFTVVALVGSSPGWATEADLFICSGDNQGAVCWLSNARLTDTATWRFSNVPAGGVLPLVLEGIANDICETCQLGRDVLVRLYYQSPGDRYWQRAEFWLRNVAPSGADCFIAYPVRGETRIFPTGPELIIIAQRVLSCDPHVGFSWGSLTLGATPVTATPVPLPTLPTPPLPPPPPPPPPEEIVCSAGPDFLCVMEDLPADCLIPGLDLSTVARQTLPDSFGPGDDAILLRPGHYIGSLGEGDFQDWYRIQASYGDAFLIWLDPGNLIVDVYLIHDPCGDVLAQCLNVSRPSVTRVPCYPGVDCNPLADECFLDGVCKLFIRITWRGGSGQYRLSIFEATPEIPES